MPLMVASLRRQFAAGLFADQVARVPLRPVRVLGADACLVLAVRGGGAAQGRGEVRGRGEGGDRRVKASGQPGGDLLQEPAVAVRVAERQERAVAGALRIRSGNPGVGPAVVEDAAGVVEDLARLGSAPFELVVRGLDVVDDQVQALGRARRLRGDGRAEDDLGR